MAKIGDVIDGGGESRETDRCTSDLAQDVERDHGKILELLTKEIRKTVPDIRWAKIVTMGATS